SRLPSETELASSYQVSRVTVRTALKSLEAQGLVDIRHGAGTFVADFGQSIRAGLQELGSISATIRELGHEPGMDQRSKVVRAATAEEAEKLDVPVGSPVLALERAVLSDGEVVAFSYDVLRLDVLPPGTADEVGRGSVFELFERVGLRPKRAFARLHAVQSDEVGWGSGRPANGLYLLLDQVHFTPGSVPLMYSRTYFVEGRFEFVIIRTA
ncbi:MAG TPA: GntR family transcriptional regulator, partial [Candidatus Limnocylindrales bacterium]|nr:GntR family transcriptional regulator [Candidatus Limnocylindrales bacterium]